MEQHGFFSCDFAGVTGDYFYWKEINCKYYYYMPSPSLLSSFPFYFTAASAIVFVNTVGRTLKPDGGLSKLGFVV